MHPSSLLNDLFRYRSRERRAPFEDFLTAALIGFVRLLPRERQFDFARNLFVSRSQKKAFKDLCERASDCRWDTQLILANGKRPDIVFWLDGIPAIVVENKISSGIAIHELRAAASDRKGQIADEIQVYSQLSTYGGWLKDARVGAGWLGSLVLLTHQTPPPADFDESSQAYGAFPHICRWNTVYFWLKAFLRDRPVLSIQESSAPAFMAAELVSFLQEKGLVMPELKFSDIDALGIHLASKSALDAAFQEILANLQTNCNEIIRPSEQRAIRYIGGVVHGWVYLSGDNLPGRAFFGWGIRFPDVSSWWDKIRYELPEENHVFACVGNDEENFPAGDIPTRLIPPGWKVVFEGTELLSAAPFPALPAAETLSRSLALWVNAQLEALRPALCSIPKS